MLAGFGLTTFRFGIEWARIEPAEGEFSRASLDHYRRVLEACREHGVTPIVTFHHFTLPLWLHSMGGFTSDRFVQLFERFCDRSAAALGNLIGYACTINEPQGLGQSGYLLAINPPGHTDDRDGARKTTEHLLEAHRAGAVAIRSHTRAPVGVCLALPDIQYEDGAQPGTTSLELESGINDQFLELARKDDFIGVQTYTRNRIGADGTLRPEPGVETTQMGYEFWPEALEANIRQASAVAKVPVIVTENGIGTDKDDRRIEYVRRALNGVARCIRDGIDVRGYCYWSSLDNYEWNSGYRPTFGLIAVDRATQARTIKPSATWLGNIARANSMDITD